eukprot:6572644-Lingulodinium_polyedra.AAC.1
MDAPDTGASRPLHRHRTSPAWLPGGGQRHRPRVAAAWQCARASSPLRTADADRHQLHPRQATRELNFPLPAIPRVTFHKSAILHDFGDNYTEEARAKSR